MVGFMENAERYGKVLKNGDDVEHACPSRTQKRSANQGSGAAMFGGGLFGGEGRGPGGEGRERSIAMERSTMASGLMQQSADALLKDPCRDFVVVFKMKHTQATRG